MKTTALAVGVCVILFFIFVILKSGREPDVDLTSASGSFLEGIIIMQKKHGEIVWKLTAEKADFTGGEDKAELQTVSLAVPGNSLTLYTDRGTYHFVEKTFTAGSIVHARGEDYHITANSLDVDIPSGVISTVGKVHLKGKGFSLEGEGMQAANEQKVKIFKDVKAIFQK